MIMRRPLLVLSLLVSTFAFAVEPSGGARRIVERWQIGEAMVFQPARPLTDVDRAELRRKGLHIGQALTGGRYIARATRGAELNDARIASIERLTPEMKVHRSAYVELGRGRTWAQLEIIFHSDVTFHEARAAVLSKGGALQDPLTFRFAPSQRLSVTVAPTALDALAADERVLAVAGSRKFRVAPHNAVSAAVSNVPVLYEPPYDLSGAGVAVSLFELAAAQADHVEFGDRLTVFATGGTPGNRAHATHVAGTIGAAGVNADAKGMAPRVRIYQFCVRTGSNSCTGDWLADKDEALAPLGVVADNNSWGFVLGWYQEAGHWVWSDAEEYYGAYDLLTTAPLDDISNTRDILFVHSAGNDGNAPNLPSLWSEHRHVDDNFNTITDKMFCYSQNGSGSDCPTDVCTGGCERVRHHPSIPYDTIGVTAAAKNVVTVGAVSAGNLITGFSSRGPAKDGRVKPDVVTRGAFVLSSIPTNSYGQNNGTSMAAPAVTGIAALITEQWRRTFAGARPTPAQLKALLIAGADDLGTPGPDYTYGFGLVNAKRSVDTILADAGVGSRIRTMGLAQGQQFDLPIVVTGAERLRVVLNWADPAIPSLGRDEIAARALVNDLDVHVVDPLGNVHLPFVLDRNAPDAAATRGINTVDNIEMVEIADAAPGTYRAVVTATNLMQGPQTVVLVSSAQAAAPCFDPQEPNDAPEAAYGNLVPRQTIHAAVCAPNDVDHYSFVATTPGPVTVEITAGDTPLRATLTGNGVDTRVDVPANSTRTLSANAAAVPLPLILKIEAAGPIGSAPQYSFTPEFGQAGTRRRSVRF